MTALGRERYSGPGTKRQISPLEALLLSSEPGRSNPIASKRSSSHQVIKKKGEGRALPSPFYLISASILTGDMADTTNLGEIGIYRA